MTLASLSHPEWLYRPDTNREGSGPLKQLEAHEVPLHKVFCSDYDFQIPNYQRPYAWETEQACQLLTDLAEVLDQNADEPYFLGSVVLVKSKEAAAADVIDGQQRLTTLTILLAVLRDLTDDEDLRSELNKMITEPGAKMLGRAPKPRLALRSKDQPFFERTVQKLGSIKGLLELDPENLRTDSQRSILANASALHGMLAKWSEGRRLALAQMLGQRTFLVVVSTPDLNSAHRIFSVMNSRGLDLSPADIFKSFIIGDLGGDDAAADACAAKWEDAEEALGREDFADLFLHLRMIFAKERAKQELLKEFPDQVLNGRFLPGRAREFVTDVLVPYADAYEQIRDQSYSAKQGAQRVNAWFRRLSQLDNNDWRPSALWALRNHGEDPHWLDKFFGALERLATSLFLRRTYTTPRVQRYAELLRQLDNDGAGLSAPAFDLSEAERAETAACLDGPIYLSPKIRKYVLLRLDELLAPDAGATYSIPLITVEHVLPQTPRVESQWAQDFSAQEREYWTHRLANLVLLNRAKNSQAQNYDFAEKKARYFTGKYGVAPFPLTVQVVSEEEWTPQTLEKRQRELLGHLASAWQL